MKTLRCISIFLIVFFLFTTFAAAQRRRAAPKTQSAPTIQRPAPTFENFLATDTYRVYVEIRGVGQLLKTPSFNDLMEPLMKVASPPIAFNTLLAWLHSQTDALTTSRLMVASWSARPKVPNVLLAIEFASPEEAQKFEARLKTFLPKILPTPTPSSSSAEPKTNSEHRDTSVAERDATRRREGDKTPTTDPEARETADSQSKEVLPSFVTKQAGALVFVSDRAFTFKNLRPAGSKLLTEDPDFRRVHDRFATESILVYFDSGGVEREEEERRRNYEKEHSKLSETAVAIPNRPENDQQQVQTAPDIQPEPSPTPATVDPDVVEQTQLETSQQMSVQIDETSQRSQGPDIGTQLISRMANVLFSGKANWPGAIGAALSFDPDGYALRLLLVDEPGGKGKAIPFMPQLISGPALTPEASALFPANTEFFATVSLDYSQIYESMRKAFADQAAHAGMTVAGEDGFEISPFAAFETKAGIKLKNDLIPLLGNEVALMLPLKTLDLVPSTAAPSPESSDRAFIASKPAPQTPNPVIAIAIRDREGVRALIPKVIEAVGFKGASLLAQTEKRGDTEVVSYADALSYAFIGNFLLISPGPKEIRYVVDAYLNHDTLASETYFRNFTRWQPRQVLGQFYLSPKLVESYQEFARNMETSISTQLADLLSRLSPTAEPLTYALSNEGLGPMHELRVPKNLALLMLASMFGVSSQPAAPTNEAMAQGMLRMVASAEAAYRATSKDGSYGSKDQLIDAGFIAKDAFEKNGYRIELSVSGSKFEASAVPLEYGKTGRLSFFVDESNVIRAGDHGGGPATLADKPFQWK